MPALAAPQLPPGLAQQSALLQELIDSAAVTVVEADMIVTAVQTVQNGATWGLDRIDQTDLPLSSTYSYTGTASDVTAYIIDTGGWLPQAPVLFFVVFVGNTGGRGRREAH